MVTASNGQDRSQKVTAPGKLTWLHLRTDLSELPGSGPPEAAAPLRWAAWQGCGRRTGPSSRKCLSSSEKAPPLLLLREPRAPSTLPTLSAPRAPCLPPRNSSLPLLPVGTAQHSGYVQGNDFLVRGPGLESRRCPCRVVSPGKALPRAQLPPQRNGAGAPRRLPASPQRSTCYGAGPPPSCPTSPPPLLGCVLTVWPGKGLAGTWSSECHAWPGHAHGAAGQTAAGATPAVIAAAGGPLH